MRNRHLVFWRRLLCLSVAVLLTCPPLAIAQQPSRFTTEPLPAVNQDSSPWRPYPALPDAAAYSADSARPIAARLAVTPRDLSEPIMLDQEFPPAVPPAAPDGILQYMYFTGTWLPALGGGDLGMSDLELGATFGFPMPTRESPLLVSPYFATHFLDGPAGPDLPPRVFDTSVQFRWKSTFQLTE